uniref:Integrase catalytic domain-containing protein n=1 Tax=Anabas testudineus TaxID=64144 RepID=A0AAQ6IJ74_ANATE
MIDYYTKWPQAYPLQTKRAEEVTEKILQFVYQFEAPKRILTDQGTEFVNMVNRTVSAKLDIKRSLCAPYHPQTNGLVERMNATVQKALCKLVGTKPQTWDQYLDAVMFGLRTKKQMTTKFSPYFLMFGREARYPAEVPEDYQVDKNVEDVVGEENVSKDIARLDYIRSTVLENVLSVQNKTRRRLMSKTDSVNSVVGDKVLRQNIRSQQRKGGKLEPNFLGPYTVTGVEGKSADLSGDDGTLCKKVNIDHLKHYNIQKPRIPHRIAASVSAPLVTA